MKPLNPYDVYADAIEGYYSGVENPSIGPWYPGILKLTILMASIGGTNAERFTALAANILAALPTGQRLKFMEEYSIPGTILAMASQPPAWPDPLPVSDFASYTEQDLANYATASEIRLALFIDTQTRRVVQGGVYTAMAYQQKVKEAEGILSIMDDGDEPDMNAFPHIAREAAVFGIPAATLSRVILGKSAQWAQVSAFMGEQLQRFQGLARSGASPEELDKAMTVARDRITGAMDQLVAGVPFNEPVPEEPQEEDEPDVIDSI